jgi:hypothetical protein
LLQPLTQCLASRFVLANTEVLHEKIQALSNRVRELEDALAEAHAYRTTESHPLLSHELMQIKRPLEREAPESTKENDVETAEAIDAVGSLYARIPFVAHSHLLIRHTQIHLGIRPNEVLWHRCKCMGKHTAFFAN